MLAAKIDSFLEVISYLLHALENGGNFSDEGGFLGQSDFFQYQTCSRSSSGSLLHSLRNWNLC